MCSLEPLCISVSKISSDNSIDLTQRNSGFIPQDRGKSIVKFGTLQTSMAHFRKKHGESALATQSQRQPNQFGHWMCVRAAYKRCIAGSWRGWDTNLFYLVTLPPCVTEITTAAKFKPNHNARQNNEIWKKEARTLDWQTERQVAGKVVKIKFEFGVPDCAFCAM